MKYDSELAEAFRKTQRLLHQFHRTKHCPGDNLLDPRQGQGRILMLLKKMPEISQKELAFILGIKQQSMGEQLKKLESNGFIERSPSEDDKRVMIVRLTKKGKDLEFEPFDFSPVFSCLKDSEKEQMIDYLNRISRQIEELQPGEVLHSQLNEEERMVFFLNQRQ